MSENDIEDMRERLFKLMKNFRIVQGNLKKTGNQMLAIDREMFDFLYDLELDDLRICPSEQTVRDEK